MRLPGHALRGWVVLPALALVSGCTGVVLSGDSVGTDGAVAVRLDAGWPPDRDGGAVPDGSLTREAGPTNDGGPWDAALARDGARVDAAPDGGGTDARVGSADGGRADSAVPALDCAGLAVAGAVEVCARAPDRCGVVFSDSRGCVAACAAGGLSCREVWEDVTGGCAPDTSRPPLTCDPPSGHQSDYCVCGPGGVDGGGRPEAGARPDAALPERDAGAGPCETLPVAGPLVGWASMNGGTTAGGSATPVVVSTADDLASRLGGSTARVIRVSGTIRGDFQVGSNKTVVGTCGAEVRGSLTLKGVSNVVIRNLKVVGHNCSDSPRDCSSGKDAISVLDESRNIWFDHLDVSDGSDGNLDVTQGSDFVTISWTKFSYASRRTDPEAGESGHRFSNLIGASDSESRDPGHLNVTFHHCWWANNVDQRMPRTRRGKIHLFNNLFTSSGNSYCTNAGFEAKLLVENNIYVGVDDPLDVSGGSLRAEGNVFRDTTGNRSGSGSGFSPTYTYTLEPTAGLEDTVRTQAGPR